MRLRRALLALATGIALVLTVALARTARLRPHQPPADPPAPTLARLVADPERLAGALRFRTVSTQERSGFDSAQFLALHAYLASAFPRVHASLRREVVGGYSLLYSWRGSDSTLPPLLLLSHMDVVPVEPGTERRWTHPPFAGRIADGFIWGRGTLDDKLGVVGILEAAERLLESGFTPRRTILFAFGHDEELGGSQGAAAMAALIARRHGTVSLLVDEGSVVARPGLVPGVARPVALIGIAEKSSVSVELSAEAAGGHSSVPPPRTAAGAIGRAVQRLEEHQMPARLAGVAREMFGWLAPEMPFAPRLAFANLWLFAPLVERQLASAPATNAMIRTTTAVTMLSGSPKENVLPSRATAVVNFRILPGDSSAGVLAHVRRVVDDSVVRVRLLGRAIEPSPVSSPRTAEFELLARSIRQVFGDAIVAPYLMVAATDTRHYERLTPNVLRFLPAFAAPDDLPRVHGTNERVSVENYTQAVRFYAQLMLNGAR